MRPVIALACAALIASGCASAPDMAPQTYDFGPAGEPAQASNNVQIAEMRAPEWLDGTQMYYRLAYRDPRALTPYAGSRWAGAPASMLTLRLRQQLGNAPGAKCILTTNVVEFSQTFDAADASRALLHVHAALAAQGQGLQKDFRLESRTATADAPGGAAAFAGLATELAASIGQWMTESGLCVQS